MADESDQHEGAGEDQEGPGVFVVGKSERRKPAGNEEGGGDAEKVVGPADRQSEPALQRPPAEKEREVDGDRTCKKNQHVPGDIQAVFDQFLGLGGRNCGL